MRPTMTIHVLLAVSALGACNWTKFDDLADETWVDSTGKPDVKSSDWGVAIQRGADSTGSQNGGTLAVIGDGTPKTFSELTYDENGKSHFVPNSISLDAQGVMSLGSQAIFFLANPASSEVSLVTPGNSGSIVVAGGQDTLAVRQLFVTHTTLQNTATITAVPEAAAYMQPKPFPALGGNPPPAPIVGVADVVMGTVINLPNGSFQPACRLTDGTNPIAIRALAGVPIAGGTTDDLLAWSGTDGRLFRYDGDVFNGCDAAAAATAPQPLGTPTKPAFKPDIGSQILKIDATRVLLAGRDASDNGFLQVFDSTTLEPIGNAITIAGLRSAAILTVGDAVYVVAGYPAALVGTVKAGQVLIFKVDATGLDATQVATFNDAQPDADQLFGRAVTVLPYRGHNVIAVAADNEVFVYFRATLEDGSDLYGETRQGQ